MTKIKRIAAVALVAVTLLAGCTDTDGVYKKYSDIDYSDTYVPGQDSQEYLYWNNLMLYGESDDAGFVSTMMSEFIYVVDKKTLTYSPLCSKPDCLHDRETTYEKKKECGAYCGKDNSFVCCGDRLYYNKIGNYIDEDGNQGVQAEIYSMKTDGSDKKCLFTFKDISIQWFRVHRGYIYYLMDPVISDGSISYDREHSVIMRVPIDGKEADAEEFFPVYEYGTLYEDINLLSACLYGNNMYLNIELRGEARAETADGASNSPKEIKVNLETKERSEISVNLKNPINHPILFNNKLVYTCNFDDDDDKFDVYECDLDGGNERKALTLDKSTSIMQCDGKNLLFSSGFLGEENGSPYVYVYDGDYNLKATYTIPDGFTDIMPLGDKMFFLFYPEYGSYSRYIASLNDVPDGGMLQPKKAE